MCDSVMQMGYSAQIPFIHALDNFRMFKNKVIMQAHQYFEKKIPQIY